MASLQKEELEYVVPSRQDRPDTNTSNSGRSAHAETPQRVGHEIVENEVSDPQPGMQEYQSSTATDVDEDGDGDKCPIPSGRRNRILEGWRTLRSLRAEAQAARISTTELRTRLNAKQQTVKDADESFMLRLDSLFANSPDLVDSNLLSSYQQLREARAAEAIEKSDLDVAEDRLIQAEGELRNVEAHMYQVPETPPAGSEEDNLDYIATDRDPTESVVSSQNIRRDNSFQAQRYLSQLGDVDLLKERLMDLEIHFAQLTEEKELREDIGLDLDEVSRAFLDNFEARQADLKTQLQEEEAKMADYKADLEDRDRYNYHLDPFAEDVTQLDGSSRAHSQFGNDIYFDDQVVEERHLEDDRVTAISHNFLLSQEDTSSVYSGAVLNSEGTVLNTFSCINSWLLHCLRKSTREIARLECEHAAKKIYLDEADFGNTVLELWFMDNTVRGSDLPRPRSAVESRAASVATNSGKTSISRPWTSTRLEMHQRAIEPLFDSLQRTRCARYTQTER
jgi:uncharacterized membrane-anchored protein YhcB (DUF1043 family)